MFFSAFLYSEMVSAEIGQSAKMFRRSELSRTFAFYMDETVDAGVYSTTPGLQKVLYKSRDGRYTIEFVTDSKGENISAQTLSFPYDGDKELAARDELCSLGFFKEAVAGKIEDKVFRRLYEDALAKQGAKQEITAGGFIISAVIYRHALYREWDITVKKK